MVNQNGTYAITEQGDLGLGLTPINEQQIKSADQKSDSTVKDKKNLTDAEKKLY